MEDMLSQKIPSPPPRRINIKVGGSVLFYLVLAAFFIAIAAYGGLLFANSAQEKTRSNVVEELRTKEKELQSDVVTQIFLLEKRLKNVRTLLQGHEFSTNVFVALESDTLPRVRFSEFNLDTAKRKVEISGETVDYATLASQISVFAKNQNIEQVEFGGLSLDKKNLVHFTLTLMLKQEMLNARP